MFYNILYQARMVRIDKASKRGFGAGRETCLKKIDEMMKVYRTLCEDSNAILKHYIVVSAKLLEIIEKNRLDIAERKVTFER